MRLRPFHRALLPLVAVLALAACHHQEEAPQPGGDTPQAAVQQSIDRIKAGDFAGFWKQALPPADYANLRTDWNAPRPEEKPITDEDRARFAVAVQQLTEPDAENKLYAQLQPKLTQMEQQYKDQLPVMIGIGQAIVSTGIAQSKKLTDTQKQQASDVLAALLPWAQKTPWFDQAKAKQAVGVVVGTARQLDLKSPDQLRTMDFETAMKKYAQGYTGAKQLLAIYGLSIDDTLNSVKLTPLDNANGHATVKVDYTLLGKPLSFESQLVQQDGRWYSEDLLHDVRDAHAQLLHPATSGSVAPATSAPAPAVAASASGPVVAAPKP